MVASFPGKAGKGLRFVISSGAVAESRNLAANSSNGIGVSPRKKGLAERNQCVAAKKTWISGRAVVYPQLSTALTRIVQVPSNGTPVVFHHSHVYLQSSCGSPCAE